NQLIGFDTAISCQAFGGGGSLTNVVIRGNQFLNSGTGITLTGGGIVFENNTVVGTLYAALVTLNNPGFSSAGSVLRNNYLSGGANYGIDLNGATNWAANGNFIDRVAQQSNRESSPANFNTIGPSP